MRRKKIKKHDEKILEKDWEKRLKNEMRKD